jgi:uncharacterized protein (TIGR03086 family)
VAASDERTNRGDRAWVESPIVPRSGLVQLPDACEPPFGHAPTVTQDELTQLIHHGRDREAAILGSELPVTEPLDQLEQVLPLLLDLVDGLGTDDLDRPTPCVGFSVRGVLEHMVGGATMFAAAFRGEPAPEAVEPPVDVVAAFAPAMAALGAAVQSEGALQRTIASPFGAVSGETFARFVALDGLVHGWDLATATGHSYDPPGGVVAAVEAFAHEAITADLRDGDTFAAAVEVPPTATALERLVAFTGRAPAGSAPAEPASTSAPVVDLEAVKTKQRATWSAGDYAVIGTTLQITGETLCEAVDLSAGSAVLDVAAGNGNASLAAARRGCRVIATDYVGALLEGTAARAAAEGLSIECREADAESLPFEDSRFDAVLSTFGAMFAPNQDRTASELARVCRPGGRVGMTNWTPSGFIGQMFKIVGSYAPPPAGVRSPLQWGTHERLEELFAGHEIVARPRQFVFRYRSAQAWLDTFRTYYGPTLKAFASIDDADTRSVFESDLLALADTSNTATDGSLRIPSEYLEVVVTIVKS